MASYETSEYKGSRLLVLKRDEKDKYPFQFGVSKAKLILDNIDKIAEFVEDEEEAHGKVK